MALIGSVVNQGSMQGQINEANGNLTGLISSAELIGGQVVGMRGLKGDKGDQGDPGADGQDGADGFSPIANVSKVGDTATITITDSLGTTTATVEDGADGQDGADGHSPVITANKVGKVTTVYADGVAIATINDGQDGGGSTAFIAEYGVTTYADVKDAYDEDAIILCTVDDSGNTAICQLAYFDDANDTFYFAQPMSDGFYLAIIASDDTWDDGLFQFASTDTATQLRNGLMDALDKQKLDGIASGAEVNVQSDWNQSVNTADDYIKNKPTIPSKTSDLNNDSGFITGITSTSTPTANEVAEFDSSAHMNSTDMSSADVSTFVAGLNTGVSDYVQLSDLDTLFVTEDFSCSAQSITAGTIGTYALAEQFNIAKTGYTPISIWLSGIGHASQYHPVVFTNSTKDKLSILFYRTCTSAYSVSAGDVRATVLYMKDV